MRISQNAGEDQSVLHRRFLLRIQFHSHLHKQHRLLGMTAAFGDRFNKAYLHWAKNKICLYIQQSGR